MKKLIKIMRLSLCLIMIVSLIATVAACSCGKTLTYSGSALADGTVGVKYSQSVASAKGGDKITYSLKEGSNNLPLGLGLNPNGEVTGIPAAKADSAKFTVVASQYGYTDAEAEFMITIGQGAISYTGGDLAAVVDEESAVTVATATGAGSTITYTIKAGELPAGLDLEDDGKITGIPTVLGEEKTFTVTASATDCTPADAEFNIKITLASLTFVNATLGNGRVNEFYGKQLPVATGPDSGITYAVSEVSELPAGLELSPTGYLNGIPTQQLTRRTFIVVASATGFDDAEAEFTITIQAAANAVTSDGTITYTSKSFSTAYVGELYYAAEAAKNAAANNRAYVSYKLSDNSELPEGFTLYPNGDLRCDDGPVEAGKFTFTVIASAERCAPVSVDFTLTVAPAKLKYNGATLVMATVGELYSSLISTAVTPDGVDAVIRYDLKTEDSLPAGLSLTDGRITGTPTKSAKRAMIIVTANAEGYTSVDAYFYLHIQDAFTSVTNGIFEAEYINLIGFQGEGWSGSAYDEKVIQNEVSNASNGYYIGWTFTTNTYAFEFTSSQVVTGARLKVRLATEIGNVTITPASFEIRVNNVPIPYSSFQLTGESGVMGDFQDYTVTTSGLNLGAGNNTIELIIKDNELMGGRIFGPGIDCIKVENYGSAVFNWRPCTYNIERFVV